MVEGKDYWLLLLFFYQPLLKPSTGKQKRNVKGAIHTMVCSHPNLIENNPMLASLEAKNCVALQTNQLFNYCDCVINME